jgi:chromosome segregation ATPase
VASADALQRSRRSLEQQLAAQKRAAERAVGQAKVDAENRVQALQGQVTAAQQAQSEALNAVKTTAEQTSTKLADVNTDVQNTKGQLQETIGNLKRATGELDSHSSLIATNGKELQALKELGERNYFEFNVNKSKQYSHVSDVQIQLKKVDIKRNRFTISLLVDDKTVEKKDRTINEPIQFYTSKARQPYEIVVNSTKKDGISGYLATPKVQTGRAGS